VSKLPAKAIQDVLRGVVAGKQPNLPEEVLDKLLANIASAVKGALKPREQRDRMASKKLYMTDLGKPCIRQLWYDFHTPELRDSIGVALKFKFLYGEIIEELVLYLAEIGGCKVSHQQHPIKHTLPNGWMISGRIDAMIDDEMVVDVKGASGFGFKKFKDGSLKYDDSFGYMAQLCTYALLLGKKRASFLAVDRSMGHVTDLEISESDIERYACSDERALEIISHLEKDAPPTRAFPPKPEGAAGNLGLCTNCSYCGYRDECYKDANGGQGLRYFGYSGKIVPLVEVTKAPRVPEIIK
jgi:hypothetical protein